MFTEDDIYNPLIQWATTVSGIPFIRAYGNRARLLGQYGLINIISIQNIGFQHNKFTENAETTLLDENILQVEKVMLSINIYRENAVDTCRTLKMSLTSQKILRDLIQPHNLSFINASQVTPLHEQIKGEFEHRGQFDVFFSYINSYNSEIEDVKEIAIGSSYAGSVLPHERSDIINI